MHKHTYCQDCIQTHMIKTACKHKQKKRCGTKGCGLCSPNRAPTAKLAFSSSSWFTAAKALKISGAPFPRASNVTPATF